MADRTESAHARAKQVPAPNKHAVDLATFTEWLDDPQTLRELRQALPDNVRPETFIRTAKQAVLTNPKLLDPAWRASLCTAIVKAALSGLMPDGKHGALVPRYVQEAASTQIVWQPMLAGICKLGRQAKAIGTIRANLVFVGETFRILAGDDDRIEHEQDPKIIGEAYEALNSVRENERGERGLVLDLNAFWERVVGAYCIITPEPGHGLPVRRFMPRARIASVRAVSRAAKGPWNSSFVDEMMIKTVILYTCKWIETDSPEASRFNDALAADLDADFSAGPQTIESGSVDRQTGSLAIAAPEERIANLEEQLANLRGAVPVAAERATKPAAPKVVEPSAGQDADCAPAPIGYRLIDEFGEHIETYADPVAFADALFNLLTRSGNREAVMEHNAEAIVAAKRESEQAADLIGLMRLEEGSQEWVPNDESEIPQPPDPPDDVVPKSLAVPVVRYASNGIVKLPELQRESFDAIRSLQPGEDKQWLIDNRAMWEAEKIPIATRKSIERELGAHSALGQAGQQDKAEAQEKLTQSARELYAAISKTNNVDELRAVQTNEQHAVTWRTIKADPAFKDITKKIDDITNTKVKQFKAAVWADQKP